MSQQVETIDPEFWDRKKDPRHPMWSSPLLKERLKAGGAAFAVVGLIAVAGFLYGENTKDSDSSSSTAPTSLTRPTPSTLQLPPHGEGFGASNVPVFTPESWGSLRANGWNYYGNRPVDTQEQFDLVQTEVKELQSQYGESSVQIGPIYDEQKQEPMSGQDAGKYYSTHPASPHEEGIYVRSGLPA